MAKDVITRFKLETTAFDSKIKQASKELSDYSKTATQAKEGFNQFTKANVDAARALGTMATSSNNTKVKVQELVGAYNEAAKAYEKLSDEQKQSDWAKSLAGSLTQLQQRIKDAKQEMQGLGNEMKSSGLFGGGKLDGMLQVFGGNLMTKAAGFAASFASEIGSCVQQGIELARQGEGIRIAFERLGRGDILDGLREATHGTVTDIELMKAAVKFNDFKLPVEELGTMLAFAQQKAKDTGQSVDYMVDSIVTGLGRKSLMILDNLGLSAAEIKEKMKQTGDMTKAVGEIIREQMAKAGDYVKTAADHATKADVELKNAMEELGRTFQPLTDVGTSMWTTLETGALKFLSSVGSVIAQLTEAGRIAKQYGNMGGSEKVGNMLNYLKTIKTDKYRQGTYKLQVGKFDERINSYQQYLGDYKAWNDKKSIAAYDRMKAFQQRTGLSMYSDVKERMGVYQRMRVEYMRGASGILNPTKPVTTTEDPKKPKGTKTEQTELQQNQQKINDLIQEYVKLGDESTEAARKRQEEIQKEIQLLQQRNGLLGLRAEQAQGRMLLKADDISKTGINRAPFGGLLHGPDTEKPGMLDDKAMKAVQKSIQKQTDLQVKELNDSKKEDKSLAMGLSNLVGGMNSVVGGLEQLGIEIPSGMKDVLGGMQAISSILTGIAATVIAIKAITGISLLKPFANGGVVPTFANGGLIGKAAGGMLIPGNSFSGDNLRLPVDGGRGMIGVNSGELILSRSQQGVLAAELQGSGLQNIRLEAVVSGEQIMLASNNRGLRTGRGEIVQSRRVR